jgi:glycosyltransferase involved in cell wall biosynthesis
LKLLSITAGAANMYCGSCLRDNALAAELRARGHDVMLVPLYTPTRTDEPNVSDRHVFFGGVSVYLQQYVPFFRRTPRLLDWLFDRPALIRAVSGRSIKTDPRMLGELTVSMLRGELGHQRKEVDKLLAWLAGEPRPDVVSLPNALLIGLARPLSRALDRPVCCTLQGEDLFLDGLVEPFRTEALDLIRRQIAEVDTFVSVSAYYADYMAGYLGIPRRQIVVAPLGINLTGYDRSPRPHNDPFRIGYFARIAPEKGLHRLASAYRHLRHDLGLPPSRLEAAGYLGVEHAAYLADVERQMRDWGLGEEFHYHGVVDRAAKIAFLRSLDVLSVPSPYHEPKGLFVLEALACGTPVVQPAHGAYPEMIERTGGGLLVPADDDAALAAALLRVWRDPELARELGERGAAGVVEHYSVSRMADTITAIYGDVLAEARGTASTAVGLR